MQETPVDSWVLKIHCRRDRLPTPVFWSFPCGSAGKESASNVGDLDSIPGLGRSPGDGKGCPLQYSGLESPMGSTAHKEVARVSPDEQLSLSRRIGVQRREKFQFQDAQRVFKESLEG